MAVYEYIRISLRRWEMAPLLRDLEVKLNKHDYLRGIFGRDRMRFMYRQTPMEYVFFGEENNVISGAIGKQISAVESDGPDNKFKPKSVKKWEAANFFIDLSDDNNEQVVAMQSNRKVGAPMGILEAIFSNIETTEQPYKAGFEYLVSREKFWTVVEENEGKISQAKFTFLPPNMLGGRDEWNKTLRELRDKDGVETTTVSLQNKDKNLRLNSEPVKEMVDLAIDGGGEAVLKSGKQIIFSSSKGKKTAKIDDDINIGAADTSQKKTLIKRLFGK